MDQGNSWNLHCFGLDKSWISLSDCRFLKYVCMYICMYVHMYVCIATRLPIVHLRNPLISSKVCTYMCITGRGVCDGLVCVIHVLVQ